MQNQKPQAAIMSALGVLLAACLLLGWAGWNKLPTRSSGRNVIRPEREQPPRLFDPIPDASVHSQPIPATGPIDFSAVSAYLDKVLTIEEQRHVAMDNYMRSSGEFIKRLHEREESDEPGSSKTQQDKAELSVICETYRSSIERLSYKFNSFQAPGGAQDFAVVYGHLLKNQLEGFEESMRINARGNFEEIASAIDRGASDHSAAQLTKDADSALAHLCIQFGIGKPFTIQ